LEQEIGVLTEDEQKGWTLFHKLPTRLRDAVRRDLQTITSRAQVLASATRLHSTVFSNVQRETPTTRTRFTRETRETRAESASNNTSEKGKEPTKKSFTYAARETHARHGREDPSPAKKGSSGGVIIIQRKVLSVRPRRSQRTRLPTGQTLNLRGHAGESHECRTQET